MVAGKVCFGDREEDFTGATGLLDWGRGVLALFPSVVLGQRHCPVG